MVIFAFASICFAQQTDNQSNGQDKMMAQTETQFSAELLDTIDVGKSKRSDSFQLKLNDDVKIGNKTLDRGTKINGRVVRSRKMSKDKDSSLVSLYIGSVNEGSKYFRFNATVVSVGETDQTPGAEIQFSTSPNFQGATIITMKGKNLRFEKGAVFQMKLEQPAGK